MIAKIMIGIIDLYKKLISPLLPQSCRFYPTCSDYAKQSLHEHGATKGLLMSAKRLIKCQPFHPGGIDRVPVRRPDYLLNIKKWD